MVPQGFPTVSQGSLYGCIKDPWLHKGNTWLAQRYHAPDICSRRLLDDVTINEDIKVLVEFSEILVDNVKVIVKALLSVKIFEF